MFRRVPFPSVPPLLSDRFHMDEDDPFDALTKTCKIGKSKVGVGIIVGADGGQLPEQLLLTIEPRRIQGLASGQQEEQHGSHFVKF